MKNLFLKYKNRKILIILSIILLIAILALLTTTFIIFNNYLDAEKEFIDKSPSDDDVLKGPEQSPIFYGIGLTCCAIFAVAILSLSTALYGLFTGKFNGKRWITWIIPISILASIMLFIMISFKPLERSYQVGEDALGSPIISTLDGPKYAVAYWALILTIALTFTASFSIKSYGNIDNDILMEKYHNAISNQNLDVLKNKVK